MKVHILISVTDPKYFDNCTLVFKTLRVGFPTARVHVTVNNVGDFDDIERAVSMARAAGADWVNVETSEIHHGMWIRSALNPSLALKSSSEPLVICDGDVHFWKSCEDWKFDAPMAGFYMPEMWNPWTNCRSVPRLHTSFLWFNDPGALKAKLSTMMPEQDKWAPNDPFMPRVQHINGEPLFWDTCANLYNMVGGAHFGPEHTACYEHLNSAGFVEIVANKMGGKTAQDFKLFHELAPKDLNFVKSFGWPMMNRYLRQKYIEAQVVPARFREVDQMKFTG